MENQTKNKSVDLGLKRITSSKSKLTKPPHLSKQEEGHINCAMNLLIMMINNKRRLKQEGFEKYHVAFQASNSMYVKRICIELENFNKL